MPPSQTRRRLPDSSRPAPIDQRRLTAVELFSGAGGMALGFERAGFDVLAAVDLDPVHLAAHERNFPLCQPICDDVARLSAARILKAANVGWARRHPAAEPLTSVDCVSAGPAAKGFRLSVAATLRTAATLSCTRSPDS